VTLGKMGAFDAERVKTYSSRAVFSSRTLVNSKVLPLQKLRAVFTVTVHIPNVKGAYYEIKVKCRTSSFLPLSTSHYLA
jgi:hypothetical protein